MCQECSDNWHEMHQTEVYVMKGHTGKLDRFDDGKIYGMLSMIL
jgi:hypothetical protein